MRWVQVYPRVTLVTWVIPTVAAPRLEMGSARPSLHGRYQLSAVGATYRTTFEFPLIGDYIVTMKIVRENRASLDVDGGYPIRDYFQYQLLDHDHDSEVAHTHDHDCDHDHDHSHDHRHDHPESLHFSVELSEKLNAILHQFTVSLTEIQYDPTTRCCVRYGINSLRFDVFHPTSAHCVLISCCFMQHVNHITSERVALTVSRMEYYIDTKSGVCFIQLHTQSDSKSQVPIVTPFIPCVMKLLAYEKATLYLFT
jgi:hypothetical protein